MKFETNTYFNVDINGPIATLQLDYNLILENTTYKHKQLFLDSLDKISQDESIKTLIISNDHPGYSLELFRKKWDDFYNNDDFEHNILRAFRTFDELYLKIKSLKKAIISVNIKPENVMLFNFSLAADLRIIQKDFIIDNDNTNMGNISKGGVLFSSTEFPFKNPFKLLFLLKEITAETLYKRQLVDRVYKNNIRKEVFKIAEHLSSFDYIELETLKMSDHERLNAVERLFQQENEFLLSCIRIKHNRDKI